ncbi:hypothetical protein C8R48DRAFT_701215 [Suillus tomentosus]|nr:hypothetical protein C8R48DRAFT_701215 [Suillus tomentosus]
MHSSIIVHPAPSILLVSRLLQQCLTIQCLSACARDHDTSSFYPPTVTRECRIHSGILLHLCHRIVHKIEMYLCPMIWIHVSCTSILLP